MERETRNERRTQWRTRSPAAFSMQLTTPMPTQAPLGMYASVRWSQSSASLALRLLLRQGQEFGEKTEVQKNVHALPSPPLPTHSSKNARKICGRAKTRFVQRTGKSLQFYQRRFLPQMHLRKRRRSHRGQILSLYACRGLTRIKLPQKGEFQD